MRPCSMQWSARLEKKLFRCWTDICLEWSQLYRQRCSLRGLHISGNDLDRIETILHNYPKKDIGPQLISISIGTPLVDWQKKDIKVIVLTDGENINGFGDLGLNAMGSSVGKLDLGTACAQIHPEQVLPVNDSTDSILNDPAYIGIRQKRDRSVNYDRLIERFILAAQETYGRSVLFIFHGLEKNNAFCMLKRYRNTATSFNDDIQGTASVVLAGLLASNQLTGKNKLSEHRFLFLGAGEADTGIADLIASTIVQQSPELTLKEAKERSFFVDSKGMVCSERKNLEHHKLPFAHDLKTLLEYNGPGFVYSILFCSSVFSFFFYSSLSLLHSSFLALRSSGCGQAHSDHRSECSGRRLHQRDHREDQSFQHSVRSFISFHLFLVSPLPKGFIFFSYIFPLLPRLSPSLTRISSSLRKLWRNWFHKRN
jgi:hypothetical protein